MHAPAPAASAPQGPGGEGVQGRPAHLGRGCLKQRLHICVRPLPHDAWTGITEYTVQALTRLRKGPQQHSPATRHSLSWETLQFCRRRRQSNGAGSDSSCSRRQAAQKLASDRYGILNDILNQALPPLLPRRRPASG